jgi:hypothetical protein
MTLSTKGLTRGRWTSKQAFRRWRETRLSPKARLKRGPAESRVCVGRTRLGRPGQPAHQISSDRCARNWAIPRVRPKRRRRCHPRRCASATVPVGTIRARAAECRHRGPAVIASRLEGQSGDRGRDCRSITAAAVRRRYMWCVRLCASPARKLRFPCSARNHRSSYST